MKSFACQVWWCNRSPPTPVTAYYIDSIIKMNEDWIFNFEIYKKTDQLIKKWYREKKIPTFTTFETLIFLKTQDCARATCHRLIEQYPHWQDVTQSLFLSTQPDCITDYRFLSLYLKDKKFIWEKREHTYIVLSFEECVAERTSYFCLACNLIHPLRSTHNFTQSGWLILFNPDHLSRQRKLRKASNTPSFAELRSEQTSYCLLFNSSSSITPTWGKPSNLWTPLRLFT